VKNSPSTADATAPTHIGFIYTTFQKDADQEYIGQMTAGVVVLLQTETCAEGNFPHNTLTVPLPPVTITEIFPLGSV
jgi:hypothetical protein